MSKLMEFARKAWFLVRVLSGYEERRIRSYRLDLQRRILQAQIRKEELRRLPEQTILAELRQMVEEMQGVNRQIQQTESAIEEYFKPLDKNAEIIINLQLEKEEERMKGMMKAMHEQSAQQQISGEAKSSESTNSCNTRPIQPIDPDSRSHKHSSFRQMASSSIFFSSLLAIAFLATAASARPGVHFHPCKTLFISYTFSSSESFDLPQIKTHRDSFSSTPGGYFTVYRVFRPLSIIVDRPRSEAVTDLIRSEPSFGMSSLHERAKDILVVVAGLLFGVGCGALTGGIMYLVWSLFSNQYETCRFGYAGEEEEEEESPKKMGYVKIADPVPVKEGYEGH